MIPVQSRFDSNFYFASSKSIVELESDSTPLTKILMFNFTPNQDQIKHHQHCILTVFILIAARFSLYSLLARQN